MAIQLPLGFQLAGVACGIKQAAGKLDFGLVVSDRPATAAGVYTTNLVFAAPVGLDRSRTPAGNMRVIAFNSGNANACTGKRGDHDAERMAALAAEACGAKPSQALVLSTGIIGEFLPMEKIEAGVRAAAASLGSNEAALLSAAQAMMTTDSVHKVAHRALQLDGRTVSIVGLAKGAAMIGPKMATMLGIILTDAPLEPSVAQGVLSRCVDDTFNCISVEGHMSTNDTVLLLANGAAGGEPLSGGSLQQLEQAVYQVCEELARAIPADGEGCSHLITLEVRGCADRESAYKIAKVVAESALVKTAIAGADPNWGRIVSAAGYGQVPFNPAGVSLWVNGHLLYEHGSPVAFDAAAVSQSIADNRDTSIVLQFSEGTTNLRFWTTDLTAEYVRLNADYHT